MVTFTEGAFVAELFDCIVVDCTGLNYIFLTSYYVVKTITIVFFQSCNCSVSFGCLEQHSSAVQRALNKTAGENC